MRQPEPTKEEQREVATAEAVPLWVELAEAVPVWVEWAEAVQKEEQREIVGAGSGMQRAALAWAWVGGDHH